MSLVGKLGDVCSDVKVLFVEWSLEARSADIPLKYFFILSDSSYEQCNVSRTRKYRHVCTFYVSFPFTGK